VGVRARQAQPGRRRRPARGTSHAQASGPGRRLPDRVGRAGRDDGARARLRGAGVAQPVSRVRVDHPVRTARSEGGIRGDRSDRSGRRGRDDPGRRSRPPTAARRRSVGVDLRRRGGRGRSARRAPGASALGTRPARGRVRAARHEPVGRVHAAVRSHRAVADGAQRQHREGGAPAHAVHLGGGGRPRLAHPALCRTRSPAPQTTVCVAARGGLPGPGGGRARLGPVPVPGGDGPGRPRASRRAAGERRGLPAHTDQAGASGRRGRALAAARARCNGGRPAREPAALRARLLARARARAHGCARALPRPVRIVRAHTDPLRPAGAVRRRAQQRASRRDAAHPGSGCPGRNAGAAPGRRKGPRLHVGHGRALRDARAGGLRGQRRED
jgi:hypothetical protein